MYVKIILTVVFLFLVPFVFSSIVAIIISCMTKGQKPVIEGNTAQRAKQLYTYLDGAPNTYFEAFDGKPVLWRRTCGIISGLCVIVFMLYFFGTIINQNNDFLSAISALFQSNTTHTDNILISIICGVLFYVPFAILHYLFTVIIQPYCDSYKKWKKFIDKVERYWLSVDKDEREKRARKKKEEEEERKHSSSAYSSNSYSSSSYSSPGLSYAQKSDYINSNFGGVYSFSAIEYIENDPNLSPSEKQEMIIFLRAYGD